MRWERERRRKLTELKRELALLRGLEEKLRFIFYPFVSSTLSLSRPCLVELLMNALGVRPVESNICDMYYVFHSM